jgi:hypothetical protein
MNEVVLLNDGRIAIVSQRQVDSGIFKAGFLVYDRILCEYQSIQYDSSRIKKELPEINIDEAFVLMRHQGIWYS